MAKSLDEFKKNWGTEGASLLIEAAGRNLRKEDSDESWKFLTQLDLNLTALSEDLRELLSQK